MKFLIDAVKVEHGEEKSRIVESVLRVVRNKVKIKNLFGWREFIDDVSTDLVGYMIQTDFIYSGGAYVACGLQAAIDACRYCNAQKRRGDYETVSLHVIEDFLDTKPYEDYSSKVQKLVYELEYEVGPEIASQVEEFLVGKVSKLSKEVLEKCRTPKFKSWIETYKSS